MANDKTLQTKQVQDYIAFGSNHSSKLRQINVSILISLELKKNPFCGLLNQNDKKNTHVLHRTAKVQKWLRRRGQDGTELGAMY